jgi:hypothetical protein
MFSVPDALIAVHPQPAWRSRGQYVFQNLYTEGGQQKSEQCWGRRLVGGGLEVGCIPIVLNHFAMGDHIVEGEKEHIWKQVRSCGSSVIRFFPTSPSKKDINTLMHGVRERAGIMELAAKNEILAIHCQTVQIENLMSDFAEELLAKEVILKWEFGFRPERKIELI